jgi:DNA-binding transcriptional LysR family regulator
MWRLTVLYEWQMAHFTPSQWYAVVLRAQQSLQSTIALVSLNSGGMGWAWMATSKLRKSDSMFWKLLLQMGHLYDVLPCASKHFWWMLWPHGRKQSGFGDVNM